MRLIIMPWIAGVMAFLICCVWQWKASKDIDYWIALFSALLATGLDCYALLIEEVLFK